MVLLCSWYCAPAFFHAYRETITFQQRSLVAPNATICAMIFPSENQLGFCGKELCFRLEGTIHGQAIFVGLRLTSLHASFGNVWDRPTCATLLWHKCTGTINVSAWSSFLGLLKPKNSWGRVPLTTVLSPCSVFFLGRKRWHTGKAPYLHYNSTFLPVPSLSLHHIWLGFCADNTGMLLHMNSCSILYIYTWEGTLHFCV